MWGSLEIFRVFAPFCQSSSKGPHVRMNICTFKIFADILQPLSFFWSISNIGCEVTILTWTVTSNSKPLEHYMLFQVFFLQKVIIFSWYICKIQWIIWGIHHAILTFANLKIIAKRRCIVIYYVVHLLSFFGSPQ